MLGLKHIRDGSFADLEREVRGNLLYRELNRSSTSVAAG
jgi:hypothetical protein